MADKPLFSLAAEGRWRLAYDSQQWVIQHRSGKARAAGLEARPSRGSGWEGASLHRERETRPPARPRREGRDPDCRGSSPARRAA